MRQKIRTVVIGVGGIARSVHLPALSRIPECELVALCDLDIRRAQAAAKTYAVPRTYALYQEMLAAERPDAAFVLVQPDQAFRIVMDCMQAGVAVFVEKPAGITLYQAETLARIARERGIAGQVGFNRRFIPLVNQVLERLKPYGLLVQVDGWFYKNSDADFYGGCASAFECDTVHVIDLVRHLANARPVRAVTAAARCGDSKPENAWNSLICFENGVTGTVHANYATGGRVHGFALHAQGASAYINIGFGAEACEARLLFSESPMYSISAQGSCPPEALTLDGKKGEYFQYYGYYDEDAAFIHSLLTETPTRCDFQDALETMRLVDMMKQNKIGGGNL